MQYRELCGADSRTPRRALRTAEQQPNSDARFSDAWIEGAMDLYEASSTRQNQNRTSQFPHRDGARTQRSIYPWRERLCPWRVRDALNQTTQPKHFHQSSAPAGLVPDLEARHPHDGRARRSKVRA